MFETLLVGVFIAPLKAWRGREWKEHPNDAASLSTWFYAFLRTRGCSFVQSFCHVIVISNSELASSGLPAATSPTLDLLPGWKEGSGVTSVSL